MNVYKQKGAFAMSWKRFLAMAIMALLLVSCGGSSGSSNEFVDDDSSDDAAEPGDTIELLTGVDASAPADTVKICFIHHSTGSAWIQDGNGNLGAALNADNYYVTETDYGWDAAAATNIGDRTDTTDWPDWFNDDIMPDVYANGAHYDYTNDIVDPGGENQIILFKSCYPNSEVGSSIEDEKAIYLGLLDYFAAHQDKLFILVVPPPEIVINSASLTRELAGWLVDMEDGWLAQYPHDNVFPFDYYNVLTDPENHHRVEGGNVVHTVSSDPEDPDRPDELYYYTGTDNHPTAAGHRKATAEFVPLLNAYYHLWQASRN
jgi:hypothetical protein